MIWGLEVTVVKNKQQGLFGEFIFEDKNKY